MKTCNKCKGEFPATREYFYADNRNKSRLQAWCKACVKQDSTERSKAKREAEKAKRRTIEAEGPKAKELPKFRIGQGIKVGQRYGRVSGIFKHFIVVDFKKYKESFLYTNIS